MQLSPHFSLAELTRTSTTLPNEPDEASRKRLKLLCDEVLEPLRALVGPLRVNSGYRSLEVNRAIGGAAHSQHLRGEAADVVPLNLSAEQVMFILAQAIYRGEFPTLGQGIIYASGFIHLSIDLPIRPRRELLRSLADGGSGGPYVLYRPAK